MRPEILICESSGFSRDALVSLESVGNVIAADLDRPALLASVPTANVLWVRLRHRIDAELFAAARELRIVASPTTGLDHVDVAAAAQRGVRVISLRGEQAFLRDVRATAELTIALLLSLLRRIPSAARDVLDGRWERDRFKGREIRGKTVGLVGYGRLGRLVGSYLHAFGARVVACDVVPLEVEPYVEMLTFFELLEKSDIVSVHVNLTKMTRHLIDDAALGRMKRGALLINTSRGDVVDSVALLTALQRGHLSGAALDVISNEDPAGVSTLPIVQYAKAHDSVLITPHLGGCTHESMEMTEVFLADQVCKALRERP